MLVCVGILIPPSSLGPRDDTMQVTVGAALQTLLSQAPLIFLREAEASAAQVRPTLHSLLTSSGPQTAANERLLSHTC